MKMFHARPRARASDQMTLLVYELLDAHDDTARMAADLGADERWQVHLGYLRDLQRVGREAMAREGRCVPPTRTMIRCRGARTRRVRTPSIELLRRGR